MHTPALPTDMSRADALLEGLALFDGRGWCVSFARSRSFARRNIRPYCAVTALRYHAFIPPYFLLWLVTVDLPSYLTHAGNVVAVRCAVNVPHLHRAACCCCCCCCRWSPRLPSRSRRMWCGCVRACALLPASLALHALPLAAAGPAISLLAHSTTRCPARTHQPPPPNAPPPHRHRVLLRAAVWFSVIARVPLRAAAWHCVLWQPVVSPHIQAPRFHPAQAGWGGGLFCVWCAPAFRVACTLGAMRWKGLLLSIH